MFVFFCTGAGRAEETFFPVIGEMTSHTVHEGEDLYDIGLKYRMAIEHLMFANGLGGIQVSPGTALAVPTKRILPYVIEEGIVLNVPERMLYLFSGGSLEAYYPVAIGTAEHPTPVADTKIVNKTKDPTWIPPEWAGKDREPVKPGPDNPLGERWIGIDLPGYGIHSTNDPLSIGMSVSHGCVRMNPADVRQLYERVYVGMRVKIVYEPVLIGRSEDDGMIYLSSFPDVYKKCGDLSDYTYSRLKKYDLNGLADFNRAVKIVSEASGIPRTVAGSPIRISWEGEPVYPDLPPLSLEDRTYVVSTFFTGLGAQVTLDRALGEVDVSLDGKNVRFGFGEGEKVSRIWKGKVLLPLRETLDGLGFSVRWDKYSNTIEITSAR